MRELTWLQQEWDRELQHPIDPTVFISIHPYVDGDELEQLKELLRKKHITFPVMVDSRNPEGKPWGNTADSYYVYSVSSEVWIDVKGHLIRLDSERGWVSEKDWWMSKLTKTTPKSKNGSETKFPAK